MISKFIHTGAMAVWPCMCAVENLCPFVLPAGCSLFAATTVVLKYQQDIAIAAVVSSEKDFFTVKFIEEASY